MKLKYEESIKQGGVDLKIIKNIKKKYEQLRLKAFKKWSDAKACSTSVKSQHAILNDLDLQKPCENHTEKQCQDTIKAQVRV